jgi:hypothetical protein
MAESANYGWTPLLVKMVPGLHALKGQGKKGDGKQMQDFLQTSTAMKVIRQYASSVARRDRARPIDFFLQMQQLPALMEKLCGVDPEGTYEVHFYPQEEDGDGFKRFRYLLVSPSYSIAGAQHLRPIVTIDGAAKEDFIGGTILAAVSLDASDHISLIALMYCESENAEYARILGQFLRANVPHQEDAITDSGKGLVSGLAEADFRYNGGCEWHILHKNTPLKVRKEGRVEN